MDLNVKTENYAIKDKPETVKKDAEKIKKKLEVQKAGLRAAANNKVLDLQTRHE